MTDTPVINLNALADAMMIVRVAKEKIKAYAEQRGLPVHVTMQTNLEVRLDCHKRIFKGHDGKRNLAHKSARIGPELWAIIEDAAQAYKEKTRG